ncbi:MAG: glutathione S-transferase family protein [Thalassotalea sp.]|nr:glutathione S-transferase family protein [Thalassotalea sp.]
MKLYTFSPAPNPQRVNYLLKYKGVSIETQEVDLREQAHFDQAYLDINPSATVPALYIDENCTLVDGIAICHYLDKKFPEKPLFGKTDEETAVILGWVHRIYVDGLGAVAEILRNTSEFFKGRAIPGTLSVEQLPALAERGLIRLNAFFDMLDKRLKNHEYIVGDKLTQADIDAYVACNFAGWVKQSVPEKNEHLIAWHKKMMNILDT